MIAKTTVPLSIGHDSEALHRCAGAMRGVQVVSGFCETSETTEILDIAATMQSAAREKLARDLAASQIRLLLSHNQSVAQDLSTYACLESLPPVPTVDRVGETGDSQTADARFEVVDYHWDEDWYIAQKAAQLYSERTNADS